MKIYVLPVNSKFQPINVNVIYPPHSKDYGVEQDFHLYLQTHQELVTQNPNNADWHYLPIYWNCYYVNHNYGKSGSEELQQEVDKCIVDDRRTFTICQNRKALPANLGQTILFLASRKTDEGIDIPLLCLPHRVPLVYRLPFFEPSKKYLASFVGRLKANPIRQKMTEQSINREDVYIFDGNKGRRFFVKKMLESYIALCPRGVGGSSYRFFEAMQLGTVPFLIGDLDTRPFKGFINWDQVSFFSNSVSDLNGRLDSLRKPDLLSMGKRAAKLWREKIAYQQWCQYVIRELKGVDIQPRP